MENNSNFTSVRFIQKPKGMIEVKRENVDEFQHGVVIFDPKLEAKPMTKEEKKIQRAERKARKQSEREFGERFKAKQLANDVLEEDLRSHGDPVINAVLDLHARAHYESCDVCREGWDEMAEWPCATVKAVARAASED